MMSSRYGSCSTEWNRLTSRTHPRFEGRRSDVWLSQDMGCGQRSGDLVGLELIAQDLFVLLVLSPQGFIATLHIGKVSITCLEFVCEFVAKLLHRLRVLLSSTFAFLLEVSLPFLCVSSGIIRKLSALLADEAKGSEDGKVGSTAAVGALSAVMAAGLNTSKASVHSVSCTNLGDVLSLALSCRKSLELL